MIIPLTYGRCGNFMFQAATAMAYAWKHGIEYTLPKQTTPGRDTFGNPVYFTHLAHPGYDPALPKIQINEKQHSFQEIPFTEEWRDKNIVLNGYWQTEKYFKEYRQQLLDTFNFEWKPNGFVSVHVRRGDYLELPHKHPPVTVEWFNEAMSRFPGRRFKFFSDDIEWCAQTFGHRDDCLFSSGNDQLTDLAQMASCEHHICSASTFSWWGAWLNRNPYKIAIMPKLWFTPGWGGCDVSDIVPSEWEKL